ncbi:MAG: hypothetical protein IT560_12155 [Alphaproteobacteria bacterium]|nr:hypothetical protein [Alphaproteobacteria bacterium]
MFIQAIKDKYAKMKDTSGLTDAQLDTRVKWAKRGGLIAAVFCAGAIGIAVTGGAVGVLAAGATAKVGLSASFMAASSAVKSFISNRICAGLQRHYEKEQIKRGDSPAAARTPESANPSILGKRGTLGVAFSNGLKSAKNLLRPTQIVSGFSAPKA